MQIINQKSKIGIALLLLSMTGICGAIQPALVKDPFNTNSNLYAWLPADVNGIYWWRVDFSMPMYGASLTADGNYLCIDQVSYGIPCKGKVFIGYGGTDWTEGGGTWANDNAVKWYYRSCATQNAYVLVPIPANYNYISFLSYNVTSGNGAMLSIDWDDGSTTGLLMTSCDTGATATGVVESTLATNASPDGVKKLRIKHNDTSGTARLIGVRCWKTNEWGDPTESRAGDADAWLGNDFVDVYHYLSYYRESGIYSPSLPLIVPHASTIDWAMLWADDAVGTTRWSGGQNHWNKSSSICASYLYHSGSTYMTNGPDIFLDGVDSGGKLDAARNMLWKGNSIRIISTGYLDYDSNEIESTTEPDVIWGFTLSSTGLSIDVTILWNTNCTVSTSSYCPMWDVATTSTGDRVIYPLDPNEYTVSVDRNKYGAQQGFYLDAVKNCLIEMSTVNPAESMYWLASTSKFYAKIKPSNMFSGANVVAGDIWFLGGNWQVKKLERVLPSNRSQFGIGKRILLK